MTDTYSDGFITFWADVYLGAHLAETGMPFGAFIKSPKRNLIELIALANPSWSKHQAVTVTNLGEMFSSADHSAWPDRADEGIREHSRHDRAVRAFIPFHEKVKTLNP